MSQLQFMSVKCQICKCFILEEYYEIVSESRPLSGFSPKHADFFFKKYISNHETKQSSKFPSDPTLIASQSTFEIKTVDFQQFISYFLIVFSCFSFYTSSAVYNIYLRQ